MQSFSRIQLLGIVMLSSRTLHMTPGVQESRQEHNKDKPKYQPVEEVYDMLSNPYGKKLK